MVMQSPQQSGHDLRIDDIVEPSLPFEFEDRTDPDVARELETLQALARWVRSRRARGMDPN